MTGSAVSVRNLVHRYGERTALDGLNLEIAAGERFAILGPNGGGKTTLFRVLSTLIPRQSGEVRVLGCDVAREPQRVRARLGVVFQAPSLDRKLTVAENLHHQGRLYGLRGAALESRAREMLERLGVADRADALVETLSGGLRRRVEIAKGLLHRPGLLLLDEPSTGLDPAARSDLWKCLCELRDQQGVTVVLTTHLLEEADKADRLAILDGGRLVALDSPAGLRQSLGGDTITIETDEPRALAAAIEERFGEQPQVVDRSVRVRHAEAQRLLVQIVEALGGRITSITLARPSLEDVFVARTGHRFWRATGEAA